MLITAPHDHSRRRMVAVGTFDGVHLGHRALLGRLAEAARERSLATAAVTFTAHPKRAIAPAAQPPMLMTPRQRADALMAVGVDDVVMLDFDERLRMLTAREFLALLHRDYAADALLLGYNNTFGHDRPRRLEEYQAFGREAGVEVVAAGEFAMAGCGPVSSSTIRQLLLDGRPDDARRLLGAPYRLMGTVVSGEGLGHTIGFPTANLRPADPSLLIPAEGVYAATVSIYGAGQAATYPAMLYIGHRPSVAAADSPLTIEAHILAHVGDIYGATVGVDPVAYLRKGRKFASLDDLCRQLAADARAAATLLASDDSLNLTHKP